MRTLLTSAVIASFAAFPIHAATVLQFDDLVDVVDDASSMASFSDLTAIFQEQGYTIEIDFPLDFSEQRPGMLGLHEPGSGAGNRNSRALIKHTRGKAFTVDEMVINRAVSNIVAYYSDVDTTLALQWPALEMVGKTVEGGLLRRSLSPWEGVGETPSTIARGDTALTGVWKVSNEPALGQPIDLSGTFGTLLTELEITFPFYPGDLQGPSRFDIPCAPINLTRSGSSCPDDLTVDFGFRNDSGFVDIDSLTLTAVPLPASVLLLGGGLLGLAALRRRRAVSATA